MKFQSRWRGSVRVLSGVAVFASKYDCSNRCSFRDMRFFMIFSEIFKKKLDIEKFQNFEDLNPVIGICEGTLMGLLILPPNMSAQNLVVFEMTFFRIFSKFFRKLRYKKITKLEFTISVVRLFQGYQEL